MSARPEAIHTDFLHLRVSPEMRTLLKRAAYVEHRPVSNYVRMELQRAARETLLRAGEELGEWLPEGKDGIP
ncbi:MAG: DUF1778 domain-containing protein [Nitrospiraceae bacterium]